MDDFDALQQLEWREKQMVFGIAAVCLALLSLVATFTHHVKQRNELEVLAAWSKVKEQARAEYLLQVSFSPASKASSSMSSRRGSPGHSPPMSRRVSTINQQHTFTPTSVREYTELKNHLESYSWDPLSLPASPSSQG